MIRSLGILGILLASVPIIILKPPIGVLMWSWISYMNPHRLAYGFIYNFPVADIVAIATLVGWAVSRESKKLPGHALTILLVIFTAWISVTTVFAVDDTAFDKWDRTIKILLFTFVTLGLMNSKNRLHALLWTIVLCLGYFALKGGVFTVLTGGDNHVFGPPRSFIADNNQLALALVMSLPLVRYLQMQAPNKWIWLGLAGAIPLWLLAILGSQSRGAFVAMACMLIFLVLKSRYRLYSGLALIFAGLMAFAFMPQSWQERMESIQNYQQDTSFQGRVDMWRFAVDVANDSPIIGGGFNVFYDDAYRQYYLPPDTMGRAVHSIYFEVLGEHGYVGLLLFLMIGITAFFTCSKVIRLTRHRPDLRWAHDLAPMLQVSLVGYAVNGLTLNLATFDLYYAVLSAVVITRYQVAKALRERPVPAQQEAQGTDASLAPGIQKPAPGWQ